MRPCPTCNKMIAKSCQFCPGCGRKFYNSFGRFLGRALAGFVALIAFCMFVGAMMNSSSTTPAPAPLSASASSSNANLQGKQLPEADKVFVRAALEYLTSANASGTKLATVMAGANDGSSTLADCYSAAKRALAEENVHYSAYRAGRGTVPPAFKIVDTHIAEVHNKTLRGLGKIVASQATGDILSLQRGIDQFQAAVIEMNSTTDEGRAVMTKEAR
jgi:hypothetical protein